MLMCALLTCVLPLLSRYFAETEPLRFEQLFSIFSDFLCAYRSASVDVSQRAAKALQKEARLKASELAKEHAASHVKARVAGQRRKTSSGASTPTSEGTVAATPASATDLPPNH